MKPSTVAATGGAEFTLRAVVVGTLLGVLFGASSLYLVLKVGLTVSASIPVAVISVALFRLWSRFGGRDATILENNIVQTAGSAGESIAFGVGVTMPAILIHGFDLEISRVVLVSVLGGLLGILMMIPLRRALIVEEHGRLKYPEGTACAEVLKAGAASAVKDGSPATPATSSSARLIFGGFVTGLAYKVAMVALKGWKEVPEKLFGPPLKGGSIGMEISPELLGVGYIIGPRIAATLFAGGVMAYLLLIPMIQFFGGQSGALIPPGGVPIGEMSPGQIRGAYLLYIGAGAVAAGGIISLFRSIPTILHGLRTGMADFGSNRDHTRARPATERDLSMKTVAIGLVVLMAGILLARPLQMNLLGAALIVVFGFIFVTVSSRLTGEIGSSSNPISGMTIATLLLTCLLFLAVGWTAPAFQVTALSVGAIVCIAASNGGTTSQDLKTGFLVGATPRLQQLAILIGSLASALLLGPVLLGLNDSATVYVPAAKIAPALTAPVEKLGARERLHGPQAAADSGEYRVWHKTDLENGPSGKYLVDDSGRPVWFVDPGINGAYGERPDGSTVQKFDAPKATLVSYIIKGILDRKLPWELVIFGVIIAVVLEFAGVPSLAFAVGVYLPISSSAPIFVGGLIRAVLDRRLRWLHRNSKWTADEIAAETDRSPGVLLASGYIAGGAIAGTIIALVAGVFSPVERALGDWAAAHNPFHTGPLSDALALIPFALLTGLLLWTGWRATARPAAQR
jgi:putative OPT family oligopeptide transporter